MTSCIFCESAFADPILPHNRQRICAIFDVTFNGKKLLHDGKICMRCQIQVDLVDSAIKLKSEMNQCLQEKLRSSEDHSQSNGAAIPPFTVPPSSDVKREIAHQLPSHTVPDINGSVSSSPIMSTPGLLMPSAVPISALATSSTPSIAATMSYPLPVLPSADRSQPVPAPLPNADVTCVCVNCGKAFKEHAELMAHEVQCRNSQPSPLTLSCDRCGQSLKYRSHEDRIKHIVQCQGQGLRRGRPSVGITSCPKCGLSLKNRMNHDRINHVERCNGNGLKRGRPSLKADEKFKCDKCGRNLWSRDQLQQHVGKCDGSHVERRGRKPGDNICMVCGENLVYRHILKKHLRQIHGINPQNLDDSVIAAVKSEQAAEELSTPYKRLLLNQIQQRLTNPASNADRSLLSSDNPDDSKDSLNLSFDAAAVSHRKKSRPTKLLVSSDLYTCRKCDKSFEHQSLFDQHCCFKMPNGEEQFEQNYDDSNVAMVQSHNDDDEDEHMNSMVIDERDYERESSNASGTASPSNNGLNQESDACDVGVFNGHAEENHQDVSDVVTAISAKAEVKHQLYPTNLSSKGSAIAQVISGLMSANKSNSPSHSLSTPVRQSIST